MTKEEIFAKLQTEVTIRGLSPGTYYTYMRAIDLFLNWSDKPYEELEEIDFRNYLLYLINRGNLTTATMVFSWLPPRNHSAGFCPWWRHSRLTLVQSDMCRFAHDDNKPVPDPYRPFHKTGLHDFPE